VCGYDMAEAVLDTGTGKGKFRAWRKIDLDRAIDPGSVSGVPEAY